MFGRGTPDKAGADKPGDETDKRAAKAQAEADKRAAKADSEAEKRAAQAQALAERQAAIAAGSWWLDVGTFRAFGVLHQLTIGKCAYLGGWTEHPKAHGNEKTANSLLVGPTGLRYRAITTLFAIPWEQVTGIEVEGPEQASKRITATRLLTIGVFALAAQKKTKAAVITVTTTDGGEAVFQTHDWLALDLRAKLTPVLSHFRNQQTAEQSAPPPTSAADEIRKLADLRDQGILTEAEFQSKKTELLSRI
jgi:hypothetical protein